MIKRKKKICRVCNTEQYLFSKGRCAGCAKVEDFKPIPKIAENTEAELQIYYVLSADYLRDNSICQCGRCGGKPAVEIHHKAGRGIYLNVVELFLAVCRECHDWIHAHTKEAIELGLIISRFTPLEKIEDLRNFLICNDGALMTWEDWYKAPHPLVSETEDAEFEIVPQNQIGNGPIENT